MVVIFAVKSTNICWSLLRKIVNKNTENVWLVLQQRKNNEPQEYTVSMLTPLGTGSTKVQRSHAQNVLTFQNGNFRLEVSGSFSELCFIIPPISETF